MSFFHRDRASIEYVRSTPSSAKPDSPVVRPGVGPTSLGYCRGQEAGYPNAESEVRTWSSDAGL